MGGFFGGGASLVGASTTVTGLAGLVPAPAAGKNTRALFSDGTFVESLSLPRRSPENNRIIRHYNWSLGSNSATQNANVRVFTIIFVYSDGTIKELKTRTGGGTISAAFNINLALWNCNEDGSPGSYIIGGNVSSGTSISTDITLSVTPTSLTRGWYYISLTPETNSPSNSLTMLSTNGSVLIGMFGSETMNNSAIQWNYTCLTSYSQTTHETLSRTVGQNPLNVGATWSV